MVYIVLVIRSKVDYIGLAKQLTSKCVAFYRPHFMFFHDFTTWIIYLNSIALTVLLTVKGYDPPYAQITSHSRAPYGMFPGCFEQKSYVHSRGPHGPRPAPYEFCFPVRGP